MLNPYHVTYQFAITFRLTSQVHIDRTQLHCTAIIMYCKSPDKAVLEPSLILHLQVTQPMSNMSFILFLMFLLKYKTCFYIFLFQNLFYNYVGHR